MNNFNEVFKNELDILKTLNKYIIEIGVIDGSSKVKRKVSVGLNNAEIMFIHENGAPAAKIPKRPVLDMTIEYAKNEMINVVFDKIVEGVFYQNWKTQEIEKELKKLCIRMENYAREIIYSNDGRLAPNAPRVAARKKGNHPLFDTGQLARSIQCRLSTYS